MLVNISAQHTIREPSLSRLAVKYNHIPLFFSIIPHIFGRNRPTVIDNMNLLKRVQFSFQLPRPQFVNVHF